MKGRFRSFAFYLGMGYFVVWVLCTALIYLFSWRMIVKSARSYDRRDVDADCERFQELLNQNSSGEMLAEAVSVERYPPSTIFILRVINRSGRVEYTATWPMKIEVPEWQTARWDNPADIPKPGVSEYFLKEYNRYIQVVTAVTKDGRTLQVGKGSFLELDQKSTMLKILLVFGVASTVFSLISGLFMMAVTIRPIRRIIASMTHIIETNAFEHGAAPTKSMIKEINELGSLFSVMTGKYAQLIQAMRQTMDHVAHDFRTPLTRIRGSAEIALGQYEKLPGDVSGALADIIEDCDRTKLQLQNLMDARELESGFVKLNLVPTDLRPLMDELVDIYGMLAEEKSVKIELRRPDHPMVAAVDAPRLLRAIGNLVDNAVKYTPLGGRVALELSDTADATEIVVSDTGIGIPEDEQGLAWQRLFRGKKAQEFAKGLGLGLNIVKIIIESHGGGITLKSRPGEGTTFTVRLPKTAKR